MISLFMPARPRSSPVPTLLGVPHNRLRDVAIGVLSDYVSAANVKNGRAERIELDLDVAARLQRNRQAACNWESTTNVGYGGRLRGTLRVVVLGIWGSTGDPRADPQPYAFNGLPRAGRFVPLPLDPEFSELYFPLLSWGTLRPTNPSPTRPRRRLGSLSMLSITDTGITQVARLGRSPEEFARSIQHSNSITTRPIVATGWYGMLRGNSGPRFGSPRVAINDRPHCIQVWGVISCENSIAPGLFGALNAVEPKRPA